MDSSPSHDFVAELAEELAEALGQRIGQTREQPWLTVEAAADYSDLSQDSIRRILESGKLHAYRPVRGRILVDRRELDSYIRSCTKSLRKGRGQR